MCMPSGHGGRLRISIEIFSTDITFLYIINEVQNKIVSLSNAGSNITIKVMTRSFILKLIEQKSLYTTMLFYLFINKCIYISIRKYHSIDRAIMRSSNVQMGE